MNCHSIEIHNHLLSEQEECLYCEINEFEQEISRLREALEKIKEICESYNYQYHFAQLEKIIKQAIGEEG